MVIYRIKIWKFIQVFSVVFRYLNEGKLYRKFLHISIFLPCSKLVISRLSAICENWTKYIKILKNK